ncbi:YagE family protein [Cordyceps javanica]|uniref:YagE family protein n=1 Tax=Cordyceps javanica TaxID=43265 RepID=A0A545URT6_9HYPO|nr:YagE family protein [Cordyceps javanica]TQW04028.1 YagE family protein [Cordyceps javanica]
MRSSPLRISLHHAARHIHSSVALPRRPTRCFHQTAAVCLPRKRSFFTSNPYLSQGGEDSKIPPSSYSSSSAATNSTTAADASSSATKRKPARAATTKNSLRRVAIIAQQPKRPGGSNSPGGASGSSTGRLAAAGATIASTEQQQDCSSSPPSSVVSAVCLAEGFHMPTVVEALSSHGFETDPDGTGFDASEVVHARAANGGDIFVFPSGTLVTWALPPDAVSRQLLRAAEDLHPPELREAEDLDFTCDAQRETSILRGELVVLGTRREQLANDNHNNSNNSNNGAGAGDRLDTTLAKIAFSSGLARSTKLAVLETALTSYFESTRHVPALLARGGAVGAPFGRRFILRKTGELLGLRARLNHYSELTDALPDIFWDSRSELGLEGYYEQVGRALDVNVRIRALNQKMDYAQEIATVLREMSSEQHGTRLEWIIIALIAVEVVFEMRHIVREWTQEEQAREPRPAVQAAVV